MPPKKKETRSFSKTEIADKVYVLDRFKKEQLENEPLSKKAKLATEWLKRDKPYTKSAIKYWLDDEEKLRRELAATVTRSKFDPRGKLSVKTLRSDEEHAFSDVLMKKYEDVGQIKNLSLPLMVHIARDLLKDFPDFKPLGKPAKVMVNRYWVMRLCKRRNWGFTLLSGRRVPVPDGVLSTSDEEIKAAIEGYHPKDVLNFDESGIRLQDIGDRSWQPPEKFGARKVNTLDPKIRITTASIISKDGTQEFQPLLIDKAVPVPLKKKLWSVKRIPIDGPREWELFLAKNKQYYFVARKNNCFINRQIFRAYITEFCRKLKEEKRKCIMILDNLPSHYFDYDRAKKWKSDNPDKACHVDDYTFENLKLIFLPPNVTGSTQPLDQGFFCYGQAKYRSWYNNQDDKNMSRDIQIEKVVEIFRGVPNYLILACWRRCSLTSLKPETGENLTLIQNNQLNSDVKEFGHKLAEMPIDQFQEDLIEELDKMADTFDDLSDDEIDEECEQLVAEANARNSEASVQSQANTSLSLIPSSSSAPPPLSDAAPALPDAAPALTVAATALSDAPPALTDAAPALTDAAPSLSDAAQALSDAAPALSDAAPAVSDAAQAHTTLTQPFEEFELQPKPKKRKITDFFTHKK